MQWCVGIGGEGYVGGMCVYVCTCVCKCVCMCMYVCMYVCMCMRYVGIWAGQGSVCVCVCVRIVFGVPPNKTNIRHAKHNSVMSRLGFGPGLGSGSALGSGVILRSGEH